MEYRGIKATELVNIINEIISKHGDMEVYVNKSGNIRPIHFADYYIYDNHIELY